MIIFSCALCIVALLVGFKYALKRDLHPVLKTLVILLCSLVFLASAFMLLTGISGRKIITGGKLFISDIINGEIRHERIPYSLDASEEERGHIQNIIAAFPNENFEIEYWDAFGDNWEYKLFFEDGKSYFLVIEVPESFIKLFPKLEYRLLRIKKTRDETMDSHPKK